jgi:hypothetical protein
MNITAEYFVFDPNVKGTWDNVKSSSLFTHSIYTTWTKFDWPDTYFMLNLSWPDDAVIDHTPKSFEKYIISFQIEAVDIYWVKRLAQQLPHAQIIVLHEGKFYDSEYWPKNIVFLPWITWDEQLRRIANVYGRQDFVDTATYKITSLCNRLSQYKFYVSAYLLKNHDLSQCVFSYHGHVDKKADTDYLITGIPALDSLVKFMETQPPVRIDDTTKTQRNSDTLNTNWNWSAHTDSVICLTNEGFHYSHAEVDGITLTRPGPPLSEKTLKPILAGQAFIAVSNVNTHQALAELGFVFDYALDLSFDQESRDLSRILKIFQSIDLIMGLSVDDLKNRVRESTIHNSRWAVSNDLKSLVCFKNEKTLDKMRQVLFI